MIDAMNEVLGTLCVSLYQTSGKASTQAVCDGKLLIYVGLLSRIELFFGRVPHRADGAVGLVMAKNLFLVEIELAEVLPIRFLAQIDGFTRIKLIKVRSGNFKGTIFDLFEAHHFRNPGCMPTGQLVVRLKKTGSIFTIKVNRLDQFDRFESTISHGHLDFHGDRWLEGKKIKKPTNERGRSK